MSLKPYLSEQFDLRGCHATLLGLGRFGGGIAAARFLVDQGAHVTVVDSKEADALADSIEQLVGYSQIQFHLGSAANTLPETDLLILNPAIPPGHPLIKEAEQRRIPVSSEIELFWQWNPARVIGVTGSNGKSTTAAMTYEIIKASGTRCWLGGNIGRSLLPVVEQIQPDDWVLLELSSFQLDALNRIEASPHIGIVTNFSPNHLDWHGTVDHYRSAKQTIFRWQTRDDFSVINADANEFEEWLSKGTAVRFGSLPTAELDVFAASDHFELKHDSRRLQPQLNVPGKHNRLNAAAAIAACLCAQIETSEILQGLENFEGLPHRLQYVGEYRERRFYNDSLATTPESAICALDAFEEHPVILLAGGSDKGVDLTEFAQNIVTKTKATALMGATGPVIEVAIEDLKPACDTLPAPLISPPQTSFEEAFAWAFANSAPGDVILLSPGCASYGWFSSFAERGERFAMLVEQLKNNAAD